MLAPDLPWSWGSVLLPASRGEPLKPGERLVPGTPGWGTMALVALDDQTVALPGWSTAEALTAFAADPAGSASGPPATWRTSGPGETVNAALGVPLTLPPGQQRTVTFAITWHFPNVQRFQHAGNLYSRRWLDALERRPACRPAQRPAVGQDAAVSPDRLPIELARRVPGRDDLAKRHPARPDLFLVRGRVLRRL